MVPKAGFEPASVGIMCLITLNNFLPRNGLIILGR